MKTILIFASMLLCQSVLAQSEKPAKNKFERIAIGYQISRFQNDFGLGLSVASPHFFKRTSALRFSANYQWFEHIDTDGTTKWTPYQTYRLGILSGNRVVAEQVRLYGEGGVGVLTTGSKISSSSAHFGGYGLFGFEFYMAESFNYYIELGGMGMGKVADKLPGKPILANGFLLSVGFRILL